MQDSTSPAFRPILLILLSTVVASCDVTEIEEPREPLIRPVKMMTLSSASDVETARYPVTVSAGQFSELSFQVGGLIEEIAVDDAQEVGTGDVIARLDQRDFQSQVNSARSQFQTADEELKRSEQLAERGVIARSALEQKKTERDVARARLDAAEKALEDSVLRAPFAGVIAQVPVRERETVSAGQEIASLINLDTLEVTVNLPARVIAESQGVEDRGAVVMLEAAPDLRIEATFKEANLLADTASQTYGVTFAFEPPEDLVILPGMNATMELSSARRSQSLRQAVPLTAIASDGDNTYVWVVDPDLMTVSRREVTIADGIGETVVVTEGLGAGETIATAGASFLADGMQVRPWSE